MFGGSGTLLISMAFSMGKSAETLRNSVHLDEASSRIVFYGASIAIGLYVSCPLMYILLQTGIRLNLLEVYTQLASYPGSNYVGEG